MCMHMICSKKRSEVQEGWWRMHKTECVSPNDRIGDLRAMLQMLAAGARWEKVCYCTYYLLEILGANDHEKR